MDFCLFLCCIAGIVLAPFLNRLAARALCKGEGNAGNGRGREHGQCAHALPVPPFVFIKKHCRENPSPRSLLPGLFLSASFAGAYLRFGISGQFLQALLLSIVLFCVSRTDLAAYKIPNTFLLTGCLFFFATAPLLYGIRELLSMHLYPMLAYGGGMYFLSFFMGKILRKKSLGGGDVKLIGMLALYLGWIPCLFTLFFASLAALLAIILSFLFQKMNAPAAAGKPESPPAPHRIPFAPFLSAAGYLMLLSGSSLYSKFS